MAPHVDKGIMTVIYSHVRRSSNSGIINHPIDMPSLFPPRLHFYYLLLLFVPSSFFTRLILCYQTAGLQVRRQGEVGGEWVDVPLGPNKVCVLVGSTLKHATGGAFKAAEHRGFSVSHQPRLSVVMRLRAGDDVVLDPLAFASKAVDVDTPRLATASGRKKMSVDEFNKGFDATRTSINQPSPPPPLSSSTTTTSTATAPHPKDEISGRADSNDTITIGIRSPCVIGAECRVGEVIYYKVKSSMGGFQKDDNDGLMMITKLPTPICDSQVKPSVELSVFYEYAHRIGVENFTDLRFHLDGERISPEWTAAFAGLRDGDIVDVLVAMCGD